MKKYEISSELFDRVSYNFADLNPMGVDWLFVTPTLLLCSRGLERSMARFSIFWTEKSQHECFLLGLLGLG